jgi:hypothetical protein
VLSRNLEGRIDDRVFDDDGFHVGRSE